MFDMGLSEIIMIAVVAIIFLGPEKLPSTMVKIAKFFKSTKETINSVKSSFEEELQIKSLKEEAQSYKKELEDAKAKLNQATDLKKMASLEADSLFDSPKDEPQETHKPKEVTLPQEESKNV
ncbi:MAG: Sec-independent protein translocase protein TatB [Sulfuricurvum sp.]|jgi:sec-independent protein translocase protein TatB